MCNSKNCPGLSWLTFLHQYMCSQGCWPWLHGRNPHMMQFMPLYTTSFRNHKLILLGDDIKCITRNFWQVVHALAYVIYQVPSGIKVFVTCTHCFFQTRQPCTKGLPGSSTVGPCQVPNHSTFNKCI